MFHYPVSLLESNQSDYNMSLSRHLSTLTKTFSITFDSNARSSVLIQRISILTTNLRFNDRYARQYIRTISEDAMMQ